MNKNKKSITLFIFSLLLILISAISFAQSKEAPNQLITDNPYREVTTVNAKKNRDHAKMSITVNKLNSEKIVGQQISENIMMYKLPSNPENKDVLVTENADDFEDLLNRKATKSQVPFTFTENTIVKVNSLNPVFIGVVNSRNELRKVYYSEAQALENIEENFDFTYRGTVIEGMNQVNIPNSFSVDVTYFSTIVGANKISLKEKAIPIKENFENIELRDGLLLYNGHKKLKAENKYIDKLIAEEGYTLTITNPGNNEKQKVKGYFRNYKDYDIMKGKLSSTNSLVSDEIDALYVSSSDDVVRTLDIIANGQNVKSNMKAQELKDGLRIDSLGIELKAIANGSKWKIEAKKIGNSNVDKAVIQIDVKTNFKENIYRNLPIVTYKLNINISSSSKLGEIVFNIDKRLQNVLGNAVNWVRGDGKVVSSTGAKANYEALIDVNGNFNSSSVKIKDIVNMEKREHNGIITLDGKDYKRFGVNKSDDRDQAAMPIDISISQLKDYTIVSMHNSDTMLLDNRFVLQGEDNVEYIGNIKEEYVGEDAKYGQATLNMAYLNVGDTATWRNVGRSIVESIDGKAKLEFTKGELFNWNSYVGDRALHIVTKLAVEHNGQKISIGGNPNGNLKVSFSNNDIGISNEGLYITKKTNDGKERTYKIEAYHNDVLLGTLEVKVVNGCSFTIDEKGDLNFGEFIPGQTKTAQTKITFTKSNDVRVDLSLSKDSKNQMVKDGSEENKNTIIPIDEIAIKEEGQNSKSLTHSYILSATAKTNKETEKGKYSGTLDLIITVVPEE